MQTEYIFHICCYHGRNVDVGVGVNDVLYNNTSKSFYVVIYRRGPGAVGPGAVGPGAVVGLATAGPVSAGSGPGPGGCAVASVVAAAAAARFFCTRKSFFPGLIPKT